MPPLRLSKFISIMLAQLALLVSVGLWVLAAGQGGPATQEAGDDGLTSFDQIAGKDAPASGPSTRPGQAGAKVKNPHWSKTECASCHLMTGERAEPIATGAVDGVCLRCHDGEKARDEAHPIGRKMDERRFTAAKFPLNDGEGGRLGCITCHDVKQACSASALKPPQTHSMLRGVTGARGEKPFCGNCHKPDETPRFGCAQ
jgi:hypothetical protein